MPFTEQQPPNPPWQTPWLAADGKTLAPEWQRYIQDMQRWLNQLAAAVP